MVFTQPFLFTADPETRKHVRSLLTDFAVHLSKQLDVATLSTELEQEVLVNKDDASLGKRPMTKEERTKHLQKACTSKVRKFFNRKCHPKPMTANRLFLKENIDEIRTKSKGDFVEFNRVKAEMWNSVKADKDLHADYTTRAATWNVEHNLIAKKSKRRTGYLLFNQENRPQLKLDNPDLSLGDISKKVGVMWHALSVDEKTTWNDKANKMNSDNSTTTTSVETPVPVVETKGTKKSKGTKKPKGTKKSKVSKKTKVNTPETVTA